MTHVERSRLENDPKHRRNRSIMMMGLIAILIIIFI